MLIFYFSCLILLFFKLFKLIDVEEITLKAGNFKKFGVFIKMLMSALDKENDSVYVDVLTYSDLEALKARKTGAPTPSTSAADGGAKMKSQMKRYVILTYRSDFDRVHYPLPLAFEDVPNGDSMQRTIKRLRSRLAEQKHEPKPLEFAGEKDMRQIITNLRQDNTELKHLLRQSKSNSSSNAGGGSGGISNELSRANAELLALNAKLKRQLDAAKRDLTSADTNYEKMRSESAKEVNKWKQRALDSGGGKGGSVGGSRGSSPVSDRGGSGSPMSRGGGVDQVETMEMRRRILELERELKLERLANSRTRGTSFRGGSSSSSYGQGQSSYRSNTPPPSRKTGVWSPAQGQGRGGSPASTGSRGSSSNRRDPYNNPGAKEARLKAAAAAARIRERNASHNRTVTGSGGSRGSGRAGPQQSASPRTQTAPPRGRSASPAGHSSSVGGRFDPTAYQRAKNERMQHSRTTGGSPGWGAGRGGSPGGRYRNSRDSGYDSNDSRGQGARRSTSRGYGSDSSGGGRRNVSASGSGSASGSRRTNGEAKKASGGTKTKKKASSSENRKTNMNRREEHNTSRGILSGSESEDDLILRKGCGSAERIGEDIVGSKQRERERSKSPVKGAVGPFPFPDENPLATGTGAISPPQVRSPQPARLSDGSMLRVNHPPAVPDPDAVRSSGYGSAGYQITSPRSTSDSPTRHNTEVAFGKTVNRSHDSKILATATNTSTEIFSSSTNVMRKSTDTVRSSLSSQRSGSSRGTPQRSPKGTPKGTGTPKSNKKSPKRSPKKSPKGTPSPRSSIDKSVSFRDSMTPGGEEEIVEIDKRIQALQNYLDNARVGLLSGTGNKSN